MNARPSILALALIGVFGLVSVGCVTDPTPINERLSEQSIGSATVGQKPGVKDRAHDYMMRR